MTALNEIQGSHPDYSLNQPALEFMRENIVGLASWDPEALAKLGQLSEDLETLIEQYPGQINIKCLRKALECLKYNSATKKFEFDTSKLNDLIYDPLGDEYRFVAVDDPTEIGDGTGGKINIVNYLLRFGLSFNPDKGSLWWNMPGNPDNPAATLLFDGLAVYIRKVYTGASLLDVVSPHRAGISWSDWIARYHLNPAFNPQMMADALNNIVDEESMANTVPRSGFNIVNTGLDMGILEGSAAAIRIQGALFQQECLSRLGAGWVSGTHDVILGLSSYNTWRTNDLRKTVINLIASGKSSIDSIDSAEVKCDSMESLSRYKGETVQSIMKDIAACGFLASENAKAIGLGPNGEFLQSDGETPKQLGFRLELPGERVGGYMANDPDEVNALDAVLNILRSPNTAKTNPSTYLDAEANERLLRANVEQYTPAEGGAARSLQVGWWGVTSIKSGDTQRVVVKYGFEEDPLYLGDPLRFKLHIAVGRIAIEGDGTPRLDPTTQQPIWVDDNGAAIDDKGAAIEPDIDTFPGSKQEASTPTYRIESQTGTEVRTFRGAAESFQAFIGGAYLKKVMSVIDRDLEWNRYSLEKVDAYLSMIMMFTGGKAMPGFFERAFMTNRPLRTAWSHWMGITNVGFSEEQANLVYVPMGVEWAPKRTERNNIDLMMTDAALAKIASLSLEADSAGARIVDFIKDKAQAFVDMVRDELGLDLYSDKHAKGLPAFKGAHPSTPTFLNAIEDYHPDARTRRDLETSGDAFAETVAPIIQEGKIVMVNERGEMESCKDLDQIFPITQLKGFSEGAFDVGYRYRLRNNNVLDYQPILNENTVNLLVARANMRLEQSIVAFKLDEMTVRDVKAKIDDMKSALDEIVAMPLDVAKDQGLAVDWYPNIDLKTQEILDMKQKFEGLFLLTVGINPDDPTKTLETMYPGPSELGMKVLGLYQDIFTTLLDAVAKRNGDIGDYSAIMDLVSKAVEEQLPKPSSQLSKLVRSLGLNLLLASYDAITPYRAMTSPTLLYDTVFRLQEGAWTLDHDVMDFVANGNHMTITRYREYGGFKYYEIALANPEDDFHIRPGSARAESTIVIRVPDNANQVRVKGIYAYIECNDVVNGIPVGAIGPTLTMDQVNEHIKNGDLNDWLANRQSAVIGGVNVGSALIPHLMMFPWISIVQGQAPWSLTGLANDVDKFLDSK